jgi:PAS domain S-box-containing protein
MPDQLPPGNSRPSPPPGKGADPASVAAALARLSGTILESLFACLPATVWMTDDRLTLTFVNGPLLRRLSLDPTQLVGRTLPDVLLDGREDHPFIEGHLTALAGHETSVRIEWGGHLYSARIGPLRDDAGRIVGAIGIHQQIGWVPDEEGTLRESDVRLRRIIDSNIIGIAFGDDQGRITDANEAFLQLAGYTREDLVADGISWPALTPVESHQRQLTALEELKQYGRCRPFEVDLIRRDGSRVAVLVGAARLSARRREGVAFVLDVSARKRLQQQLGTELACADALLDARSPGLGLVAALETLCDRERWAAGLYGRLDDTSHVRFIARHGDPAVDDGVLEQIAQRALAGQVATWSAQARTLTLPLGATEGPPHSVLMLIAPPHVEPGEAMTDVAWAVGSRVARYLDRHS